MRFARTLLSHRRLAFLLCAATLLLRLVVPTGYMIGAAHGHLTMELCSGTVARPMAAAMPGMAGSGADHGGGDHGKGEMPCAFSGLSATALGATDPVQLVALVAFIMAAGLFAAPVPAPVRRVHLRPPLRGPPAYP